MRSIRLRNISYIDGASPQKQISYVPPDNSVVDYHMTGESIPYVSNNHLPEFFLYVYVPTVK